MHESDVSQSFCREQSGWIRLLLFAVVLLGANASSVADCPGLIMKADRVTLYSPGQAAVDNTVFIPFRQSYDSPPLVFLLPHNINGDPLSARVVSVSTDGFRVGLAETPGEDGLVPNEKIHYLAVEPGRFYLANDNFEMQIGSVDMQNYLSKYGGSSYATVNYPSAFSATPRPISFAEVQTINNSPGYLFQAGTTIQPWLEASTRYSLSNSTRLRLYLETAETRSQSSINQNETVAYLSLTPTSHRFIDNDGIEITLNALRTADNISGNCTNNAHANSAAVAPIAIANRSERDGGDGGWLRLCFINTTNVSLQVEEDQSNDSEQAHTRERANLITFSQAFDLKNHSELPDMEAGVVDVAPPNYSGQVPFTQVSFPTPFESVPNIFIMPTDQEPDPASVRIRNVTTNGFEVAQVQPQNEATPAQAMNIDYFAIADGITTVQNGDLSFEVNSIISADQQGRYVTGPSYSAVSFNQSYSAPPVFLADIQTVNSEPGIDPDNPSIPWLETAVNAVDNNGAQLALERVKTSSGTVVAEKISYLATAANRSTSFVANGGKEIEFKTINQADSVQGWDDIYPTCKSIAYPGGAFSQLPLSIANVSARHGNDGSWLRNCYNNSDASQLSLVVDEDRVGFPTARAHTAESVSALAFSEPFEWCPPKLELAKTATLLRDPVHGDSNPKAIPGAFIEYKVQAQNQARIPFDDGTLVIVDPVPLNSVLYLGNDANYVFRSLDGSGANSSGLMPLNYAGPGSTSDDVEFSADNGSTWTHVPVAGDDGFDTSATTHVRFRPDGVFKQGGPGLSPEFSVYFTVKVSG